MVTAMTWCFAASVAMVALTMFGYPLLLGLLGLFVRPRRVVDDSEPAVSLIIAAHNEEAVIAAKIENALATEYPREKLEIFVASDGSVDDTNRIVEQYKEQGVILVQFPRIGKTEMQNRMARRATGEILVFSDANAFYEPDAIRMLVRNFADATVGGVCGQLVYRTAGEGAGMSERLYWGYEKFIKQRESNLSSVVGANGSIYAVRRSDYIDIDPGIISDFVEPLLLVRSGKRFVYEPRAVSIEEASTDYGTEYRRKVRILTRAITGLLYAPDLLNPLKYGIFSIQLILHKLLRFLLPLFVITGILAAAGLVIAGHYRTLLIVCALAVIAAATVGRVTRNVKGNVLVRVCHLVYYYVLLNWALVISWVNVLRGNRMSLWSPERGQA